MAALEERMAVPMVISERTAVCKPSSYTRIRLCKHDTVKVILHCNRPGDKIKVAQITDFITGLSVNSPPIIKSYKIQYGKAK
jgi:hypothetical protein